MPIEVRETRAFEGPNIYYPQPAVKLTVWADRDISRAISDTLKTWAQVTGLVIGYLRQHTRPDGTGMLITTTWTTPFPTVGARIAQHVVEDLQAAEQHDEDYDHDEALFAVLNERKRQEPSMALLQVYAEAQARDLPVIRRADGQLVIGTGARSWSFDPAGLSLGLTVEAPWENIGAVPLVAVTGPHATAVTRTIAQVLEQRGQRIGRADDDGVIIAGERLVDEPSADFAGTRHVLTDPRVDVAVVAASAHSILERGLGFNQCRVGVVTGVEHAAGVSPNEQHDLLAAHGVVALATEPDGAVVLNVDEQSVWGVRDWVASRLVLYGTQELPVEPDAATTIVRLLDTTIRVSSAAQHVDVARRDDLPAAQWLAAVAALYALGIDIAMLA